MNKNETNINTLEINKLKKHYENMIALMPGHVYWKDIHCVYQGCNNAQAKSLGLSSRHEIVGKTDYDLSPKDIADEIRKVDLSIIQTKTEKTIEEVIIKEGSKRIVLSKKVPLYDEASIVGILGISFDITAEKEALRLEKQLLEEQESVMRLLASSIAHELRTPLAAIRIGSEGIGLYLPDLVKSYKMAKDAGLDVPWVMSNKLELLSRSIDLIQMETQEAFSIIDMMLMNANTLTIDKEKFQSCSIANCIETAIARYPFQKNEVDKIHWQKSDFTFLGNDLLMTHVIFNLMKNALFYLKAANKGDIHIWCEQQDELNVLHFKDTGLGIDEDVLPKIFDRFYSRTLKGTGVGLAFCKLVMESFGGSIICQSVTGEFTEFLMTFPKSL